MSASDLQVLRPHNMGQLLDQSIRLYRRNFLKFIGIIAVIQIPLSLLQLLLSWVTTEATFARIDDPGAFSEGLFGLGVFLGLLGNIALIGVQFILVRGVATAATAQAVADDYLGEAGGLVETYRRIGPSWLRVVGGLLLVSVFMILSFIWLLIPCVGWLTGIGPLLFISMVFVPLAPVVAILERQTVLGSLRRVWDLVRRRFWWVMGFVALLYLFNLLVVGGPTLLLNLILPRIAEGLPGLALSTNLPITQTVIQSLVTLLVNLIFLPLQLTAMTLLYFDLRIRTEGLDLAFLAESTLSDQVETADVVARAPPPERGNLITWLEVGYFAIISIGLLVVFGVIYGIIMAVFLATLPSFG